MNYIVYHNFCQRFKLELDVTEKYVGILRNKHSAAFKKYRGVHIIPENLAVNIKLLLC